MKQPTTTSLVLAELRGQNDYMSEPMLRKATGAGRNQVNAACHHLRKRHAIDCVIETDGRAWWFALTPEHDDRSKTVEERTLETKPRRQRRYHRKEQPK